MAMKYVFRLFVALVLISVSACVFRYMLGNPNGKTAGDYSANSKRIEVLDNATMLKLFIMERDDDQETRPEVFLHSGQAISSSNQAPFINELLDKFRREHSAMVDGDYSETPHIYVAHSVLNKELSNSENNIHVYDLHIEWLEENKDYAGIILFSGGKQLLKSEIFGDFTEEERQKVYPVPRMFLIQAYMRLIQIKGASIMCKAVPKENLLDNYWLGFEINYSQQVQYPDIEVAIYDYAGNVSNRADLKFYKSVYKDEALVE